MLSKKGLGLNPLLRIKLPLRSYKHNAYLHNYVDNIYETSHYIHLMEEPKSIIINII